MTTPSRLARTSSIVAIVSTVAGTLLGYLTLAATVKWPPFHESSADATVRVVKGRTAQGQDGCADVSCAFVVLQLKGFPAGATVNCSFDSSVGAGPFVGLQAKVDSAGAVEVESTNYFGNRGGWVSATCDGVRGEINPW